MRYSCKNLFLSTITLSEASEVYLVRVEIDMPHLLSFRSGWENERLASYLLSRFSFVAQPSSVSEDLGSDFFCTIFEIVKLTSGHEALRPLSSFAIQIKSSPEEIAMDNKIDYLLNLELPFFVGVVSQSPPALTIYSAESLALLFATFGVPEKLSLLPIAELGVDATRIYDDLRQKGEGIRLNCPLVATFSTADERSMLVDKVAALHKICTRAHSNIASRANEEHIYDTDGKGSFQIVAGPRSVEHFRMNFVKRLGEVFRNLDWLFDNGRADERWKTEFELFDSFYQAFSNLQGGIVPAYVAAPYHALRQKLERHRTKP